MASPNYSDEPRLIQPKRADRRFFAFLAVVLGGALLLLAVIGTPMYRNWQEEQSHLAERGDYEGALYTIDIDGRPHRIELGWSQDRLLVGLTPPLPADTQVRIKGSFIDEALPRNPASTSRSLYGPSHAQTNPFGHYRLALQIERDGQPLWSGKLWAWGIHDHSHHHH